MFQHIAAQAPDPILSLMRQARQDTNPDKIDLTIGVYFDDHGNTPIMRAVKAAETMRTETETTKTYLGLDGDANFTALMQELTFANALPSERVAGLQTPGGSGAICLVAEVYKDLKPDAKVWASNPSYHNHLSAFKAAGFSCGNYPYLSQDQTLNFAGMVDFLESKTSAGDIVILHASCHNPSGVNLTLDQWHTLTGIVNAKGLVPFIDMAYQGLGDGLDTDAAGLRHMAANVPNAFIAISCSKNFGLYRERAGALYMVTENAAQSALALGAMHNVARRVYSMPPHHGADIVRTILTTPELKTDWLEELESYRTRVNRIREGLSQSLKRYTNSDAFDFIGAQRGMFSLLPLDQAQIDRLRDEHSIYTVPTGDGFARVNVAACAEHKTDLMASALAQVL